MTDLAGIRAVALDVDGTLAGADHSVSDRTIRVLHTAQERGLAVIIITGRARQNTIDIARAAGLRAPVISCNGSIVTDPSTGDDLRIRPMPASDLDALITLHRELDLVLTWWTPDEIHISSAGEAQELLGVLNQQPILVGDPADMPVGSVVKAMLSASPERLDAADARIRELAPRVARSMPEFFELVAADASKWAGLAFVLERLGIAPEECLGIGDGGNDVPWLSRIGYPVAMGNARDEVHAVARHAIGHHADDGVAEFLENALRTGLAPAP